MVKVYTLTHCPYCVSAKKLLHERNIPFQEVRVLEKDDLLWEELYLRSKMKTMPQIYLNDKIIGGFQELEALDQVDQLESLKV